MTAPDMRDARAGDLGDQIASRLYRRHWNDRDPIDEWDGMPFTAKRHWLKMADEVLVYFTDQLAAANAATRERDERLALIRKHAEKFKLYGNAHDAWDRIIALAEKRTEAEHE